MTIKLLSDGQNWAEVIEDMRKALDKLGVVIEFKPHFMGHLPREEYRPGRFGIERRFLSAILPNRPVILHTDRFRVQGAAGWFSVMNGRLVIQVFQRGTHSREPDFKKWESEIIVHELCHYFYWRNGLPDRTHYWHYERNSLMGAIEEIYIALLKRKVGLLERIVRLLRKRLVAPPQEPISRIKDWALAIKTKEGWFKGSLTQRHNNPGALRWSRYQSGNKNGFAVFPDYETGMKALIFQLTIAADGRSKVYRPEMTLLEFFERYAPSSDNNNPLAYANFVAKRLNIGIETQIKTLL